MGYCDYERRNVLEHIGTIVQHPPFTGQITYPLDQARFARALREAQVLARDPSVRRRAAALLRSARSADPTNPDLPTLAEDVDDDGGDLAAALADARAAAALQPRNFALATDQAIKLSRLGRTAAAEALLRATARRAAPRDRALMAPAFADLFVRTGQLEAGRRYFAAEIAANPGDENLRLLRCRFERLSGQVQAAERDYRAALRDDPASAPALEGLLAVLQDQGRAAEADDAALAAWARQPANSGNDLRCAVLYARRGNAAGEMDCLLAAERCGPVTSGVELKLAQILFTLQRPEEAVTHLGWARLIAGAEGDAGAVAQINSVIEQLQAQAR